MPCLGVHGRYTNPMILSEIQKQLPAESPHSLQPEILQELLNSNNTLVVLDDDPTGTQTVSNVLVLTKWDLGLLKSVFNKKIPVVFLLTNSRSLNEEATKKLHADITKDLYTASQEAKRDIEIISRSDSTLRGHFALEVETIIQNWGKVIDFTLFMPFFLEGGRYTIHGQHYVQEGEKLIVAHETPFANDPVFAFKESFLPNYIEEKTHGRIRAGQVVHASIELIRNGGVAAVMDLFSTAEKGGICIADALTDRDAEVVAMAIAKLRAQGRTILARTAASYVRARSGIAKRALLSAEELRSDGLGGLVIVGSHVPKTTKQFHALLEKHPYLDKIEISVNDALLRKEETIQKAILEVNAALSEDRDVVFYTSRELIKASTDIENLNISALVSDCLVRVVQSLQQKPRFIIAKGGITSSDIATEGLNVSEATVIGSILPGVPVWKIGESSKFPNMPYVIFPGNVGSDHALAEAVTILSKS